MDKPDGFDDALLAAVTRLINGETAKMQAMSFDERVAYVTQLEADRVGMTAKLLKEYGFPEGVDVHLVTPEQVQAVRELRGASPPTVH